MNNREIKLAYIAGALDGDGSFSLIKGTSHSSVSPLYFPMIQLANASKDMIDLFCEEFGGSTNVRKAYIGKDGSVRKISHQWKVEKSKKCLPILEEVAPYLVIKKERCLFLRDYIIKNPFIRGSNVLDDKLLYKREQAYLKMRSFNDEPSVNGELLSIGKRNNSESELFWAYVAGLMDTDGSFSLKKESTRPNRKNPTYTPMILLSMVDCRAIYYLMNNFLGATVSVIKATTATNGFCYRFNLSNRLALMDFLRKSIPFLRLKKKIAETLLEYCEVTKRSNGCGGISNEELSKREHYYSEIIHLNKYGVSKSSLMDLKLLPDNAGDNKAQAAKAGSVNVASGKTSENSEDAVL